MVKEGFLFGDLVALVFLARIEQNTDLFNCCNHAPAWALQLQGQHLPGMPTPEEAL